MRSDYSLQQNQPSTISSSDRMFFVWAAIAVALFYCGWALVGGLSSSSISPTQERVHLAPQSEISDRPIRQSPSIPPAVSYSKIPPADRIPVVFEGWPDPGDFARCCYVRVVRLESIKIYFKTNSAGLTSTKKDGSAENIWKSEELWRNNTKKEIVKEFARLGVAVTDSDSRQVDAVLTGELSAHLLLKNSAIPFLGSYGMYAALYLEVRSSDGKELIAIFDIVDVEED